MRRILVGIVLTAVASSALAETLWVRPKGSCTGTCNGSSYATPFNGVAAIQWGASTGQVGSGDTLMVCGDFDRTTEGTTRIIDVGASGTSTDRIVIDGGCSAVDASYPNGRMWASRRIDTGAWTLVGNGVYSTPWTYTTEYAAEGAFGSEVLLRSTTSTAECEATNGSIYKDTPNNLLYYNPTDSLTTVWTNWSDAIRVLGNDYLTIRNLVVHGAQTGEHAAIALTGTDGTTGAVGVVIEDNEVSFAGGQLIECYRGCDGLVVEDNVFHEAPVATYLCRGAVNCSGITMRGNEVYSGRDLANIYNATAADRHALGGQNISDSLFERNHIHDWAGDGIHIWVATGLKGENNTIRYNRIERLDDDEDQNWHWGIALGGSNETNKGDNTSGWLIYNNIIADLDGDGSSTDEGAAIRVKATVATDGTYHRIFNNTIRNAEIGIWLREIVGDYRLGAQIHNNVIDLTADSTPGNFVVIDNASDGSQINLVNDTNAYLGGGSFSYRGTSYSTLATWQTALGGCPGAGNDCASAAATGYGLNADDSLPALSPAIDLGTDQGLLVDLNGQAFYGPVDAGAIESVPPYMMGAQTPDQGAAIRVYGDGRYRNTLTPVGTPIQLLINPMGGDGADYLDVAVSSWTADAKTWSETSDTITGTVAHSVCGLSAGAAYSLITTHEGSASSVAFNAPSDGCHDWDYAGGYSTAAFSLLATSPAVSELSVTWTNGCRIEWPLSPAAVDGYQLELNTTKTRVSSATTSVSCQQLGAVPGSNSVRIRSYVRDSYSQWTDVVSFSYEQ